MTVMAPSSAVTVIDATAPLEQAPLPGKETAIHKSRGGGGRGGSWLTRRRPTRSSAPTVDSGRGRSSMTVPTEEDDEDDMDEPYKEQEQEQDEEQKDVEADSSSSSVLLRGVASHNDKGNDKDITITPSTATTVTTEPLLLPHNEGEETRMTPKTTTPNPRHIRWTTVEIREYAIMLGDNPSVSRGVPLTMDWTPLSSISLDLDAYESRKPQPPRRPQEMIRSASDREDLLLNRLNAMVIQGDGDIGGGSSSSYTRSMLLQAQRTAYMVRDQRRQTNQMRKWDHLQELLEKATRTLQRRMGTRPSKQWERAYLELHCSGGGQQNLSSTETTTPSTSTTATTTAKARHSTATTITSTGV